MAFVLAVVDWATVGVSVGSAIVGLFVGAVLRGREWVREKRLAVYDAFVVLSWRRTALSGKLWRVLSGEPPDVTAVDLDERRQAQAEHERTRTGDLLVMSREGLELAHETFFVLARMELVASQNVYVVAAALHESLDHLEELVREEPPVDRATFDASTTDVAHGLARFTVVATRDVGGLGLVVSRTLGRRRGRGLVT